MSTRFGAISHTPSDPPTGPEPATVSSAAEHNFNASAYRRLLLFSVALAVVLLLLGGLLIWQYMTAQSGALLPWIAGAVIIAGLALLTLLVSCIYRELLVPLTHLRDWARHMRGGDLATRVPIPATGEFAGLARDINGLSDRLQGLSEDMKSQVRKQTRYIEQKTRSLEILYDVAASINVSRDLNDLLIRFLHTLVDVVDARAGIVRLTHSDGDMHVVASVGIDDEVLKRERVLPSNQCLCGSSFEQGAVLYQNNLANCGKIIGMPFFRDHDIGMIAVPLQYRDRTLGVYNLFVAQDTLAEQEDMKHLLTSIGRHLGMAIDKSRLDEETNRLSIMDERTRMANELHDSLAQSLASLRFQVRVLDETLHLGHEQAIWSELEKIENSLDEAYGELRELITHFRAPIDKRGLLPAVEHLVERFRNKASIQIYLQREWDVASLAPETEVQVIRIIQETLTNIRKHSQAHTVRVIMHSDPDGECRILIEDDGIGFDTSEPAGTSGDHVGLNIMEERAHRINGTLRIESEPGEGTRVLLRFNYLNGPVRRGTAVEELRIMP